MAATVQVDSDPDPNKKTCFKHVVVIWEKKNGVDLTNELVNSLPLKKNGLVVKDKQAFMTHKNKTTKDNELWEGRVRKLYGKFTLVTFSDKFKAWQPYNQISYRIDQDLFRLLGSFYIQACQTLCGPFQNN